VILIGHPYANYPFHPKACPPSVWRTLWVKFPNPLNSQLVKEYGKYIGCFLRKDIAFLHYHLSGLRRHGEDDRRFSQKIVAGQGQCPSGLGDGSYT